VAGWIIIVLAVLFIYLYNGMVIRRNRVEDFLALYEALGKKRAELIMELLELPPLQGKLVNAAALRQAAEARLQAVSTPEKVRCNDSVSQAWALAYGELKNFPELKNVKSNAVLLDELTQFAEKVPKTFQAANHAISSLNNSISSPVGQILQKLMHLEKHALLSPSEEKSEVNFEEN